ncbi:MAG: hypothetical protein ACD_60C00087G0002 [uncultured bacterium]|nr:MAG: hypothetical protein ACD_60C00087G0002 [uncultured bacterium]
MDLSILPCEHLTGVGKRTAERLANIGICSIQDLLFHLPMRYQDRSHVHEICDVSPGEHVVVHGEIESVALPKGGRTRLLLSIKDRTGHLRLRFFYVNTLQRNQLQTGVRLCCYGEVRLGSQGLEMIHPEYQVMTPHFIAPMDEHLTPIYPATERLSQLMLRKLTEQALRLLTLGGALHEIVPEILLKKFSFPSLKEALQFVHRPPIDAPLPSLAAGSHISQKRLVFEELLAHRLSLLNLKKNFQVQKAISFKSPDELIKKFLIALPFKLTPAQEKVTREIQQDLSKSYPMLRLVQGDVGSGKTVVAVLAMLQAVENGYQAAFMAPTELLAEQHFHLLEKWLTPFSVHVVLLSGRLKTEPRREALAAIKEQRAQMVIGTHAIFQKEVEFAKLALVVIDEQHRFGVQQRAMLREKGVSQTHCPHQLIMTATPIPRTLAMSVYADLDCSVIDELPPGRMPVITRVIANHRRDEILSRIRDVCLSGCQAYWVCALIEESEVLECKAAENTVEELRAALPELKIGLLHGRMKSDVKEKTMQAFKKGELHLLVATTVIEVGVDVPDANLMIIDNAERLGLAQLHQLRGRVGRSVHASYCLLLYKAPLSDIAKARLSVMRETTDGFKIAERDLELRGPGEVLGTKQTGDVSLRIADLVRDSDLLPAVSETAAILQQYHPELIDQLIQRWLVGRERFGHV